MKRKLAAYMATVLLLCSMPAWAHRIDEYLQAPILSLGSNQAHASMRLVPGVMVAPSVIAMIDANHDGVFSENEKRVVCGSSSGRPIPFHRWTDSEAEARNVEHPRCVPAP